MATQLDFIPREKIPYSSRNSTKRRQQLGVLKEIVGAVSSRPRYPRIASDGELPCARKTTLACRSAAAIARLRFLQTRPQFTGVAASRSGVSKIEARLSYVDDKTLLYLAEVLRVPVQDLFPPRTPGNRIHDFMEKLETTRF